VTDGTQLVERRTSNRKVAKRRLDAGVARRYILKRDA